MMSLDDDEVPASARGASASSSLRTALTLKSTDGVTIAVQGIEQMRALKLSVLFATMLEGDQDCTEIPVPFRGVALSDVVDYLLSHNGVATPLISSPLAAFTMKELCHAHPADAHWIDCIGEDNERLHALIMAASSVDCASLLNLAMAKQSCIFAQCSSDFAAMQNILRIQKSSSSSLPRPLPPTPATPSTSETTLATAEQHWKTREQNWKNQPGVCSSCLCLGCDCSQ